MNVKSVEEEPHVNLYAWHFVRDERGYRLLGFRTDDQRGRITSGVTVVDMDLGRVMTESGRVYRLHGDPDPRATELILLSAVQRGKVAPGSLRMASADEVEQALAPAPQPPAEPRPLLLKRIEETVRRKRMERLLEEEMRLADETDRMIKAIMAERKKRDWRPD